MIGKTISHYKILEKLGEGGMGVVYKAQDTKLKRTVALKFLTPHTLGSDEEKARFVREAQAAAALDHPNICTVYEIDEAEEQTFISMAYIKGQSLKDRIESGPLKLDEAIGIAIQVGQGLQEAHERKIVHRDIKSANIMITDKDQIKIMDFGLAKIGKGELITKQGTTLGTVAYMSPEQAKGEEVDHRTDIWSVGVLLYEVISGRRPFRGDYDQAVLYSILNEEPEPITALRTGVPMELERIVNKCLEKEPSDRYQHADELIADSGRLKKELKSGVIPSRKVVRSETPRKRFQSFVVPGILLFIAILMVAGYFLFDRILQTGKSEIETISKMKWEKSIAVLPFEDLSSRKDQEYFCVGMTEDIITKLSRVEELKVISRASAMRYKNTDKDIKKIGKELGVETILEGSIRKEKNNIRITAQLINVEDGFHLWADNYDRRLESVFEVQDEVSKAIAEAMKVKLTPKTLEAFKTGQPKSIEAYEYCLKGTHFISSKYVISNQEKDFQAALRMFEKAIEIDPNYALAYAGLVWAYESHFVITGDERDRDLVLKNSEISYELDPNLAQTNAAMGWSYYTRGEYDKTYQSYKRALEINPNVSEINHIVGLFFRHLGLYPQAIKYHSRSTEIDPFLIWSQGDLARSFLRTGEFEKSTVHFKKALEIAPNSVSYLCSYVNLLIMMKKHAEAEEILARAEKINPGYSGIPYCKALLLAAKGQKDKALALGKDEAIYSLLGMKDEAIKYINDVITECGEKERYSYLSLINNPFYEDLYGDARFKEIVKKQKKKYEERLKKYGELK